MSGDKPPPKYHINKRLTLISAFSMAVALLIGGTSILLTRQRQSSSRPAAQAIPSQAVSTAGQGIDQLVISQAAGRSQQLLVQGDGIFSGNIFAANFHGDGSGILNINATNINTGTLNSARLSADVTKLGQTIPLSSLQGPVLSSLNSITNNGGNIDLIAGSNVTVTADPITHQITIGSSNPGGTITGVTAGSGLTGGGTTGSITLDLDSTVTTQGNSFNGISQLVQTTAGGLLPALSGANLTSLNATNIASGTLADARLSANVALLNGTGPQTFTGNNKFTGTLLQQNAANSTTAFQIQDSAGTTVVLNADTTNGRVGIGNAAPSYALDVTGDINSSTALKVGGVTVCTVAGCTAAGSSAVLLQAATPGTAQTGNLNITGTAIAATFSGSGASLTSLNGSNISSGTVADARLSTNVTLQGNSFNGISQLVQTTAGGLLPALSGANLTSLNATNIASGTVADARLSTNVTLQGNSFNGASQLVQLTGGGVLPVLSGVNLTSLDASNVSLGTLADARLSTNVTLQGNSFNGISQLVQTTAGGLLPALSGANLTSLNATNIASGTLSDARLSANVALLNGTGPQTFTGNNKFTGTLLQQNAANSTTAFQIQDSAGTSNLLVADTTNTRLAIGQATASYTVDVAGDVNISGAYRVGGVQICTSGGCTATSGSGNYIQNQNSADQAADFRINGTGQANTSLLSPLLDVASAGSLGIGTSTATSLNIGNSNGTTSVAVSCGTGTCGFGNNAIDHSTVLGSVTGTSATTLQSGTGGVSILSGANVSIGASDTTGTLLVVDTKTGAGDPTGSNGGIYYNSSDNKFRCYQNSGWTDCISTGGGITAVGTIDSQAKSADGAVISGSTIYLQTADATNPGLISTGTQTIAGAKTLTGAALFKNAADSTTAFQIQNSAASPLFVADTTNTRIAIGQASASYTVDVAGDVNITGAYRIGGTAICTASGCTSASGSGSYIQNQSASDQTADFRISGTGRANTALQSPAVDTAAAGTLTIGGTNATTLDICNSLACDTVSIATNADADAINIGDSLDTLTLTGSAASTIVLNAVTISAAELNLLDGHDVALVDTNDAVATAIVGTGALDAGSITANFGSINTGADNITTTGTLQGSTSVLTADVDAAAAGALGIGNLGTATSVGLCNSANCDTLSLATNADADAINIGDSLDTITITGNSSSTFVINGSTVDATEFNRLDGKDAALVDTNDAVATAIVGTGALDAGSITANFGSIDTGADNITTTGTVQGTTSVLTSLLDTVTGVTLNIGTTNATGINLNQNVVVAATKTLTVTSGLTSLTGNTTGDALNVSNSTSTGDIVVFKDNSTAVATIADGGGALFQNSTDSTTAFRIQNQAGTSNLFIADTTNTRIGIGTASPTETLTVAGNIKIGKQTDSVTDWSKVSQSTAGTIAASGTASINSIRSMATYNGSLYVGTSKTDAAEVYRYDGGTTWTKVSQTTAGTIASGGTASINEILGMVVYNGQLYIGTHEDNSAEVYRYDGGTTWTKVSQTTAGTIASGGTASIDYAHSMAVHNGSMYLGTYEAGAAEVYRYDGGTTWTKVSQSTAGTIASGGTASINGVMSMSSYDSSLYAMTGNPAEVYRYDGGTTWTKVSQTTAGTIASGGTASIDRIRSSAVYNGSLYVGTEEANATEVYRYDGGTTWTKVSQATAGTIASGGTASINEVRSMAVYNGQLYVGTVEGTAEVYRYDGGTTWTKVSQSTAGTIASGGTANIDTANTMAVLNGNLYMGTEESTAAEVYSYTAIEGQSYALKFGANSTPTVTTSNGFPTVAATNSSNTQSGTSHTVSLPASISSGDLLIVFFSAYNGVPTSITATYPAGWTKLYENTSQPSDLHPSNFSAAYKTADGTEGSSISVTTGGVNAETAHISYRITGWDSNVPPEAPAAASGGSTTPNPPSLTPSWGAADTLWLATAVSGFTTATVSSIPTNYTNNININSSPGSTLRLASARRELNASSEDPGTFTFSVSSQWRAGTVGIKPSTTTTEITGTEQASYPNEGAISFLAEQNPFNNTGNIGTGSFLFTHGITTATGAYDLAEDYPTRDDSLQAGDVVSIDPNEYGFVRKTASAQDSTTVGIYSTKPGLRLSQQDAYINGGRAIPVALAGRVEVKVTNENGPIAPGDYLTSSSTPGYAMKATGAGPVIGKALAAFDQPTGKVLTFVNVSNYNPAGVAAMQGGDMQLASLNVAGSLTSASLTVTGQADFKGDITIAGHIITDGTVPTATVDPAAGTGATATIDGNDQAGTVTITTGSGAVAGDLATLTYKTPYSDIPNVFITAANAAAAAEDRHSFVTQTSTDFRISNTTALPPGTILKFYYWVVK
jgi:hypothetical protein